MGALWLGSRGLALPKAVAAGANLAAVVVVANLAAAGANLAAAVVANLAAAVAVAVANLAVAVANLAADHQPNRVRQPAH